MSRADPSVDVGRLLAFALDISASPVSGVGAADYACLIHRYLEDAPFRALFDGVVEGAGCEVASANRDIGLVLRTRPDGPWAWPARSSDSPWGKFEDAHLRAARGLVVVALFAYLAPSAADLEDLLSDTESKVPPVGVRELEQFIRDFCTEQEVRSPDPFGTADARPLWWHWLQLPAEAPTARRISSSTTIYIVHDVLSYLHGNGWLIDVTPKLNSADKRYRPRRRLLHHFHDLLLDDLFSALRLHAEKTSVAVNDVDRARSFHAADSLAADDEE